MYAPTSTNSPRFGPTSGDDDGLTDFDGAAEILRAWGSGLRPDPDLTVSEWADRHRMLSGRASAEPVFFFRYFPDNFICKVRHFVQ